MHVNTWANRFLFNTGQLKVSVGDLSGGEQARILIARLMLQPADLLILDEPTNDLDIPSLEVLEESLAEFPGAIVLVTHDRFMLDRLSTSVLGLDGRGNVNIYPDYSQWAAARDREEEETRKAVALRPATPSAAASSGAATTGVVARVKRLSYNEQREWDQIEGKIEAAEKLAATLEATVNDPAVMGDRKRLEDSCRELGAAHDLVAHLWKRWGELEAKQK
jgi:ATP-binding cassette subfamily F protein uup